MSHGSFPTDSIFLILAVDETQSLAMSLRMQEPTHDKTEVVDEEILNQESDPQTPEKNQESQEKADAIDLESAKTAEPAEELDPWEQLEMDVAKWKDQAIRTAAELENYRKRMSREKLDALRYGNQGLLEELLPVLDNFNMGMQAAEQEKESMLYMGMNMVHKQIGEFLSSQGVTEVTAIEGGDFDPNIHEALSHEVSADVEVDKIMRVIRKGYQMGERLLRPANVLISSGPTPTEEAEPQTESE